MSTHGFIRKTTQFEDMIGTTHGYYSTGFWIVAYPRLQQPVVDAAGTVSYVERRRHPGEPPALDILAELFPEYIEDFKVALASEALLKLCQPDFDPVTSVDSASGRTKLEWLRLRYGLKAKDDTD